jgi:glycosyltransferase involved in cell wall biosynthesis
MRLAILNRSLGVIGGVETYLKALLPKLAASGNEIWFGYETEPAPDREVVIAPGQRTRRIREPAELRGFIRDSRADAVFLHGLDSVHLEEAARAEARVLLFLHAYHGACISGTKRHAFPSLTCCSRPLGPGCLAYYFPRRCGGLNPLRAGVLYRDQRQRQKGLRNVAGVVVGSEHMRIEALRNGVDDSKVFVAPLFSTLPSVGSPPPVDKTRSGELLFVGRVTKVKGLHLLVEALPLAQQQLGTTLQLNIAGDGEYLEVVVNRARRLDVNVQLHGWADSTKRDLLMRRADLLVMPSLWPEPFGIAGVEAASVGLPAAAFAVGGIEEWLLPGITGEVSTGTPTPRGLATAIVRALCDPAHYRQLRVGAFARSRTLSASAHLSILERALAAVVDS